MIDTIAVQIQVGDLPTKVTFNAYGITFESLAPQNIFSPKWEDWLVLVEVSRMVMPNRFRLQGDGNA